MKTKTPQKSAIVRKAKKPSTASSRSRKKVVLVHAKRPALRHFRLIENKHTFKLVHLRHTSHLSLVVVLLVVGLFLYASGNMTQAQNQTGKGSILVGAIVPGPPPSLGATIKTPSNAAKLVGKVITEIKGTCQSNTFAVVRGNGLTIGSTNCAGDGTFNLQAQLQIGKNVLSALNYDNMNQPGPVTPEVIVYLSENDAGIQESMKTVTVIPANVLDVIPDNPSIITGVSKLADCTDYNPGTLPTGGELHVSIVCVPRLFFPGIQHQMGIIVWGGEPPYAVSINWGKAATVASNESSSESAEDTLLSIPTPGYKLVKFNYTISSTYRVMVIANDKNSEKAVIQTAIQVNGQSNELVVTSTVKDIFNVKSWFESPVPFYLLAIAITLGFWGGDIFDRKFGASKLRGRSRKTA